MINSTKETTIVSYTEAAISTTHIEKGENGHHIWESVYRAFGIALGYAINPDNIKGGATSGVAGEVVYELFAE